MRAWPARLFPAAFGLLLGCSELRPPLTSPAQGGAPWTEVTSKHFIAWTDLDHSEGSRALAEFEQIYTAMADLGFPSSGQQTGRVNLVLFAREKDYFQFAPEATTALFVPALPNDLDEVPTMLMFGGLVDETRLTFQHELTHMFIRESLGLAPPWLHEGLAEYYSTLRVEDGYAYLGDPLPHRGISLGSEWRSTRVGAWNRQLIPLRDMPSVRRLISADHATFYAWAKGGAARGGARQRQAAFYCGSWGLAHLLMNGPVAYQQRFRTYLDALAHGSDPDDAWRLAFGDIPSRALEEGYRTHMRLTEKIAATVHRTRYSPPLLAAPVARSMSASEVHLLWARLRPWLGPNLESVRVDLESAGYYDAASPEVHFWNGRFLAAQGRPEQAEVKLRAAVEARGSSALYLFGLATLYASWRDVQTKQPAHPDRLAETVARLSKLAISANALDFVAAFHADQGTSGIGLEFAARAVKADPTCFRCLDTLARLLFAQGMREEAVAAEVRALSLVPSSTSKPEIREHLRRYRKAVKDAGRAPVKDGGGAATP